MNPEEQTTPDTIGDDDLSMPVHPPSAFDQLTILIRIALNIVFIVGSLVVMAMIIMGQSIASYLLQ